MAAGHSGQCTACTFCHHSFASHEELVRHISIHRQEERPFVCRICRKIFKQQAHWMSISEPIQTTGIIFVDTGQPFKQSGHLKRHILRRHTDRALLPHACSKCSQKYATKWDLEKHFRANHLKGPQKRPYEYPRYKWGFTAVQPPNTSEESGLLGRSPLSTL